MGVLDFSLAMMDLGHLNSASCGLALRDSRGVVGMMDYFKVKNFLFYYIIHPPISESLSLSKSTTPSLPFAKWSPMFSLVTIHYNKWLISLERRLETCSIPHAIGESNESHVCGNTLVFTPFSEVQTPRAHHTTPAQWSLFGHCSGLGPNTLQRMQCMQQHIGDHL